MAGAKRRQGRRKAELFGEAGARQGQGRGREAGSEPERHTLLAVIITLLAKHSPSPFNCLFSKCKRF